jgi:hypothetical protein
MKPASSRDAGKQATTTRAPGESALEALGATQPVAARLKPGDLTVLEAVLGQDEPITLKRIARLIDAPPGELHVALEALCEIGLLRRLNTIVESYTARFR